MPHKYGKGSPRTTFFEYREIIDGGSSENTRGQQNSKQDKSNSRGDNTAVAKLSARNMNKRVFDRH